MSKIENKVMVLTAKEYRRRVCLAMNYISRNLNSELSLEEVAGAASFSQYHFHRIFKAVVGETVAGFTRRLRLELAANRLKVPNGEDITTIALECGFSSSQNFAKAFRKHFNVTPSAFRKSKQGHIISKRENALSLQAIYSPDTAFEQINNKRRIVMQAEVKDMEEYTVAYVRKMGPYGKEACEAAFTELMQWAGPNGYVGPGVVFGVYWDNPEITPAEKCRTDACVAVPQGTEPPGQIGIQVLQGGPYAVCGFEIDAEGFPGAWEEAFAWLVKSGHECADLPCYERYHNDAAEHPEGKWIVDICIPLKR